MNAAYGAPAPRWRRLRTYMGAIQKRAFLNPARPSLADPSSRGGARAHEVGRRGRGVALLWWFHPGFA